MMKYEFEKLAGYEVSDNDYYNVIEPMYMAVPDISKQDFVKMLDKKRFALETPAQIMRKIKKEARHLFEICGHYTDYDSEHRLEALTFQYAKRKFNLDWAKDSKVYVYTLKEYEFPSLQRGCTYPCTLVIGRQGNGEYERIKLV